MRVLLRTFGGLLAAGFLVLNQANAESNWPRWRGPQQNGHSTEKGLPVEWGADTITWKVPLKGRGHSSPVIWGERIVLTTAIDDGRQRMVFCVNRNDGRVEWEQIAWSGDPEPSHRMNGWASATCATDGQRVYAFFGRGGGLHCYTLDGQHVWSTDLGPFAGPWGTAACPLLVDNMVIQNCDADTDAYVAALDKLTGEFVWKTPRDTIRGWSSPVLIETGDRREIVMNGHTGVYAYDPVRGRELWHSPAARGRGTPTVTPDNGLLYVINGLSGVGAYCLRPGGEGDVSSTHRMWLSKRSGRDLPSPIIVGDQMLVMSLRGAILTGYDKSTGEELWAKRVGGQVSSTPVAYDNKAFFINESGETIVVDPQSDQKIVTRNSVPSGDDELFRASITPSDGQVFIRSDQTLFCIGKRSRNR